ncbi:hypothetical protein Droror1_Dr00025998 [Drosera rotundifolia]
MAPILPLPNHPPRPDQDTTLISRFLNTLFTIATTTTTSTITAYDDVVFRRVPRLKPCPLEHAPQRCCVRENKFGVGRGIHGLGVKNVLLGSVHLGTCLIDFYGKRGDVRGARFMFDEMP